MLTLQRVQVQSLVGEQRSHMLQGAVKKTSNFSLPSRKVFRISANYLKYKNTYIRFFLIRVNIQRASNYPLNGASGKESTCQCRRQRFDPWVGKISQSRKWQPTPVFLPGKFHGQRGLAGYSPWGHKESDMTGHIHTHTQYSEGLSISWSS